LIFPARGQKLRGILIVQDRHSGNFAGEGEGKPIAHGTRHGPLVALGVVLWLTNPAPVCSRHDERPSCPSTGDRLMTTSVSADNTPLRITRRPWYQNTSGLWSLDFMLTALACFGVLWGALSVLASGVLWLAPNVAVPDGLPAALALSGLLVLLLWYRHKLAVLYDAQWKSTRRRPGYLIEQPWPEAPVVSGVLKSQLLREGNPRFAIPSTPTTPEQDSHFNWTKWPISFPRALRSWAVAVPWTVLRMVFNKLTRGTWASAIADDQIIAFAEGTSTCVFCELQPDGRTLKLAVPAQLPLCTWHGRRIAGFELWMDTDARRISRCTFEGRSLLGDNDLIFGMLILAMTHYQHSKSHLMAEQSTLEIERRGLRDLAPSARFTLALHHGLMTASQSPLAGKQAPLTATGVDKESVKASMAVHMPHYIDERKNRYRFYQFLARGRVDTIMLLHQHGIGLSAEAAFNNMVLHPVDHAQGARLMRGLIWSMDLSGSFMSYARSRFFADVIAGPLTNPMVTERLCDLDPLAHPFYAELHEKLHAIDREYADLALTSCSF
jgi:hypothetical protein